MSLYTTFTDIYQKERQSNNRDNISSREMISPANKQLNVEYQNILDLFSI